MVSQLPLPQSGPMAAHLGRSGERNHGQTVVPPPEAVPADDDVLSLLTPASTALHQGSELKHADALTLVRRGLPFVALENLVHAIGAPQKEIAGVVGIPATTLARRRRSGQLTPVESDHVVRIARLCVMARSLMGGDAEAAQRWLTTSHLLLGDETPLRRASTETGGREVEQLIGQLRHGVFS